MIDIVQQLLANSANGHTPSLDEAMGHKSHLPNGLDPNIAKLEEIVSNVWQMRSEFYNKFMGGQGGFGDGLQEYYERLGYPAAEGSSALVNLYRILYDRDAIANRVVQVLPRECWQVAPTVSEDESASNSTPFEKAWDVLSRQLRGARSWYKDEQGSPVWEYLFRGDVLSGIGTYGVILLGIDDGKLLEQPVEGAPKDGRPTDITGVSKDIYGGILPTQLEIPFESRMGTDAQYFNLTFSPARPPGRKDSTRAANRRLLFLRCFDATLVQVVQYEADIFNPRFGQPLMYWITLNDPRQPHSGVGLPLATVRVHWSRVVHLADNLNSSEIFGFPRQQTVLNRLLDLQKLYGGSAEMYWRGAFPGLSIETLPQLGGDVNINIPKLRNMMSNYAAGLDRWIALMGMTAKSLAPQVVDPKSQIEVQLEAICIQIGCPVRVFKGSERGELASSQDDSSWNDRLAHRQQMYITPRIIVPFVDRLIMLGVLPEPGKGKARVKMLDAITVENVRRRSLEVVNSIGNDLAKWDQWFNLDGVDLGGEWGKIRRACKQTGNVSLAVNYAKMMELTRVDRKLKQSPLHNAMRNMGKLVDQGEDDSEDLTGPADYGGVRESPDSYMDTPEEAGRSLESSSIDPDQGYSVAWPDLDSTTRKDKATIALQTTQAMAAFVSGGVESFCDPLDWYTRVLGWTEEEAMEVIEAVKAKQEEDMLTAPPAPSEYDKSNQPPVLPGQIDEDGSSFPPEEQDTPLSTNNAGVDDEPRDDRGRWANGGSGTTSHRDAYLKTKEGKLHVDPVNESSPIHESVQKDLNYGNMTGLAGQGVHSDEYGKLQDEANARRAEMLKDSGPNSAAAKIASRMTQIGEASRGPAARDPELIKYVEDYAVKTDVDLYHGFSPTPKTLKKLMAVKPGDVLASIGITEMSEDKSHARTFTKGSGVMMKMAAGEGRSLPIAHVSRHIGEMEHVITGDLEVAAIHDTVTHFQSGKKVVAKPLRIIEVRQKSKPTKNDSAVRDVLGRVAANAPT
jgi:uncharacterized protein